MDPLAALSAVAAARAVAAIRPDTRLRNAVADTDAPPASDHTELSPGAQLVEALLHQDAQDAATPAPARPLLAAPPAPGPQAVLAQALQHGLRQSGLFYESHQAGWTQGSYPLSELLQEPQGRLPALPAPAGANPRATGPALASSAAGHGRLPAAADAAAVAGAPGSGSASAASGWPQQVDPRAGTLVQQQLQTLDSQVVPWHGQLWPGQFAEWRVAPHVDPEARGTRPDQAAPPKGWTSQLKLSLPALGEVDAELQWDGTRCSLRVAAPAQSLPGLRAALPGLARVLAEAGVPAERIQLSSSREKRHV